MGILIKTTAIILGAQSKFEHGNIAKRNSRSSQIVLSNVTTRCKSRLYGVGATEQREVADLEEKLE